MDKSFYATSLLRKLSVYFDIEENVTVCGLPFAFRSSMHRRNERYVLMKKNVLYAYDIFEYFYLYQKETMTKEELQTLMGHFLEEALQVTKPNKEHMSSDHILVIHLDQADDTLRKFVKKYRCRKYFHHGLQGTLKAAIILVENDGKSAVFSRDLKDKKYQFVLEK